MDNLTKLTPVYARVRQLGAEFRVHEGWNLADSFDSPEKEITAACQGVAIADESARGKLTMEGSTADEIVQKTFGTLTREIGSGTLAHDVQLYRLRPDKYYLDTPPGGEVKTMQSLTETARGGSDLVTITDMTHGCTALRLIGPESVELLSQLCGLDFQAASFHNLTAKQSSVAKTTQIVIRHDLGEILSFSLVGGRSLGPYLWDIITEAGRKSNLVPIGQATLDNLYSKSARKN